MNDSTVQVSSSSSSSLSNEAKVGTESNDSIVASNVTFESLCKAMLATSTNKLMRMAHWKKIKPLTDFMMEWRKQYDNIYGIGNQQATTNDSLFAAIRLMLPNVDNEPAAYNLKTKALANRISDVFGICDRESDDAQQLMHFANPDVNEDAMNVGNFAKTVVKMANEHFERKLCERLSIADINRSLDALASGSTKEKNRELEMLIRKTNDLELEYLIYIILKESMAGIHTGTVLNAFHPDACALLQNRGSLRQVCIQLHDPKSTFDLIQVHPFHPFVPMRCGRVENSNELMEAMAKKGNTMFYVETKYDGERVQLHRNELKQYRYFSRNGKDWTQQYGASTDQMGTLTPYIDDLFDSSVRNCILDGEMVGWDPTVETILRRSDGIDVDAGGSVRKRDVKTSASSDWFQPCFVVFDCLFYNDRVLTTEPLSIRLDCIRQIITNTRAGRLMIAPQKHISTVNELAECFNAAIDRNDEGIVAKRPNSTYCIGKKTVSGGWIKLKQDYIDCLCDDVDLVAVGASYGAHGVFNSFLMALVDDSIGDNDDRRFATICDVKNGLTKSQLVDLTTDLRQMPLLSKVPEWLRCHSSEKADVYFSLNAMIVFQIRAARIQISNDTGSKFSLLFPRITAIRNDKSVDECTLTEFQRYRTALDKNPPKLAVDVNSFGMSLPKKRRLPNLLISTRTDFSRVKLKRNVFDGKVMCIFGDGENGQSAEELETIVVSLGGEVVKNPVTSLFCIIADNSDATKVVNQIKAQKYDIVRSCWLLRCRDQLRHVPWFPHDMIYTPSYDAYFGRNFDCFGDSYTEPLQADQLKRILDDMKVDAGDDRIQLTERAELMKAMFGDNEYALFRGFSIYVDQYSVLDDPSSTPIPAMKLIANEAQLYGATITAHLQFASHIILDIRDTSRIADMHAFDSRAPSRHRIVTTGWIIESIKEATILAEEPYSIV